MFRDLLFKTTGLWSTVDSPRPRWTRQCHVYNSRPRWTRQCHVPTIPVPVGRGNATSLQFLSTLDAAMPRPYLLTC